MHTNIYEIGVTKIPLNGCIRLYFHVIYFYIVPSDGDKYSVWSYMKLE